MGGTGSIILAIVKRFLDREPGRFNSPCCARRSKPPPSSPPSWWFILIGARIFSLTFYGVNGHLWVEHLLTSLPGGQVGFLVFVNALVFVLAFFLDFFEIAFIIIPLIGPAAQNIGVDLIWLGVMLGVNLQTSFMHPPFGFALFHLRSVAPKHPFKDRVTGAVTAPVTTGQIYWGAVPFVIIQAMMVGLIIAFPAMVMHYKAAIPAALSGQIEIQVPPINLPVPFNPEIELPKPPGPGKTGLNPSNTAGVFHRSVPWWWFQTTRSLRHPCEDAVFQAISPWHETCLGSGGGRPS